MNDINSEQTISWNSLILKLDEFVAQWAEHDSPPELGQFIPEVAESERRVWLVELIKVDLEHRWQGEHEGRFLEDYAIRFPDLCDDNMYPLDLIYEEFHIRRQLGEEVDLQEFRLRFPEQADELDSLFEFESPDATTSVFKHTGRERFEVGEVLDDFDLLMPLGEGAFAQVFLARQISMQRLVALKISAARGEEHKTLAQLDHPHIVRVFSQTVLEDREIRLLYMQYLPGGTLKDVVEAMRKLPEKDRNGKSFLDKLDEFLMKRGAAASVDSLTRQKLKEFDWQQVVCWIGARLAEALDYSHSKGVLHRDLKPANVLVGEDGAPKLADFNISFCKQIEGSNPVAYFGGSLAYMSPEQLEACDPTRSREPEDLDARSDVYSLGVMLCELLQGYRPFPDLAWALQGSQLLSEMLSDRDAGPDLSSLETNCSPLLMRTFRRCMSANRDERFASGKELARQLDLCTDPEVGKVLFPEQGTLPHKMLRFPILSLILLIGLPNIVMSLANIAYNWDEIVKQQQEHQQVFGVQVGLLNLFAYGTGLTLCAVLARPIGRWLKRPEARSELSQSDICQRTIGISYWSSIITLALWLICGILFPLGLHWKTGGTVLNDYVHFMASHTINGALAAILVFYLIAEFALEQILPQTIDIDAPDPRLSRSLARMDKAAVVCIGGMIVVPLAAILFAVGLSQSQSRVVFGVMAVTGMIGAWFAYRWAEKLKTLIKTFKKICDE